MYFIKEYDIIDLDNGDKLLMNLINGAADVITEEVKSNIISNNFSLLSEEVIQNLKDRKYLFDNERDRNIFISEINERLDCIESNNAPNFLIIPTYDCNLRCTYCYEQSYGLSESEDNPITESTIDSMFDSISNIISNLNQNNQFNNSDIYITLMGGEPLMKENLKYIEYILKKIRYNGFKFNAITNGVDIDSYIDLLDKYDIQSVQITLDGPKSIHDSRRIDKNNLGSYDSIVSNIRLLIDRKIETHLRVNIDNTNIQSLPKLADEIIEKIGLSAYLYPYIYLLQDGGCNGNKNIIDEISCIKEIVELESLYPNMKIYAKTFHGKNLIESIFDEGPFKAKLRNCAANRNQYILDFKGDIYKCWFGIGNKNFKIGEFLPTLNINHMQDQKWKDRNIFKISKCTSCNYKYICGGGCVTHILLNNKDLHTEHCYDFKEIIKELFISKYMIEA